VDSLIFAARSAAFFGGDTEPSAKTSGAAFEGMQRIRHKIDPSYDWKGDPWALRMVWLDLLMSP